VGTEISGLDRTVSLLSIWSRYEHSTQFWPFRPVEQLVGHLSDSSAVVVLNYSTDATHGRRLYAPSLYLGASPLSVRRVEYLYTHIAEFKLKPHLRPARMLYAIRTVTSSHTFLSLAWFGWVFQLSILSCTPPPLNSYLTFLFKKVYVALVDCSVGYSQPM
jgi:hypothetical protein